MAYDYRNHPQAGPYAPPGAPPMYPRVSPSVPSASGPLAPPLARAPHAPSPSFSAGSGIRVAIKPEYRISPPPQLVPLGGEVPRCTFQFDFELERKVLAEAEKERPIWSTIVAEQQPPKTGPSSSAAQGRNVDPVVDKYVKLGLSPEAVSIAVLNYGDNNVKVREFVKGFNTLREMGFSSKSVGEVLLMYDNDTDKGLGYLLNSSS